MSLKVAPHPIRTSPYPLPSRHLKPILTRIPQESESPRFFVWRDVRKAGDLPAPSSTPTLYVCIPLSPPKSPFRFATPIDKPFLRTSDYHTLKMFTEFVDKLLAF